MTQRTFSIGDLEIVYGGSKLSGFADGEFFTATYDDDFFKFTQGADGEVARTKNQKFMASITIRFLQTSLANDILSGYLIADLAANAPLEMIVKDMNGTTSFVSAQTTILKFADFSFGEENSTREWSFKAAKLVGFLGGNKIG